MESVYYQYAKIPLVIFPRECLSLEVREEMISRVVIKLSIVSLDHKGHSVYSGDCRVQLTGSGDTQLSYPDDIAEVEQEITTDSLLEYDDISKMPVIFSDVSDLSDPPYYQSQVWKDPSVSPYVYNHYDRPVQQTYSVLDNSASITIQQHNTYITKNVYNYDRPQNYLEQVGYKQMRETPKQLLSLETFSNDEESESEMLLSQLSKKKKKNKGYNVANTQRDNEALKQLMATNIKSSKQRKTILFQGESSETGQTIQKILYTDPKVKCSAVTMDNELPTYIPEESSASTPRKKKYQCDKCKTIFDQISVFRQHMVGNHTNYHVAAKSRQYVCSKCDRKFSDQLKYNTHCEGHGDPDLECPICHKVYASKNNLKIHLKIHNRKYRCTDCTRSYDNAEVYKTHLKTHLKFVCQFEDCNFTANSESKRDDHYDEHIKNHVNNDPSNNDYGIEDQDTDSADNNHQSSDHADPYSSDQNNQTSSSFEEQLNFVYNDDIEEQFGIAETSSNTEIGESLLVDYIEDFQDDLTITECELKSESSDLLLGSDGTVSNDISTEDSSSSSSKDSEIIIVDGFEPGKDYNEKIGRYENEGEDNSNEKNENEEPDMNEKNENEEPDMNENATLEDINKEERIRTADSVIAKVVSDELFLPNTRMKNKYVRGNKTCLVCHKSFDRAGDLKRHLIEHVLKSTLTKLDRTDQGILQITCAICLKETFSTIDKYKAHLREHARLTLYKCTFCDKSFSDSSNFSKHKKIHGFAYFQCDMCRRKFNSKIMLSRHLELHEKSEPLECKHCQRLFPFESMLKKHLKSVHYKNSRSKFSCRFCPVSCKALKDKWDHEWEVHGIRKMIVDCLVCDAKFRKFSELKRHCSDEHHIDIPTQKELLARKTSKKVKVQRNDSEDCCLV